MVNFDEKVNRNNTEATKWERFKDRINEQEMIPMWLADMDLPCSDAIRDAMVERAKHPIYGYTDRDDTYLSIFAQHFNEWHDYNLTNENVVLSTGVMYSITCAIRLLSSENDHVVVLSPTYGPFITAIENSNRKTIRVPLVWIDNQYSIDFKDLEIALQKAKVFLLCNPHNPTGRVFTQNELTKIANLCERYNVEIIDDEIHCDITYKASKFIPIMNCSEYAKEHTIACVAPTKSFNIAGLKVSAAVMKNKSWHERFKKEAATIGISSINLFAMKAVKAAYLESGDWQKENLVYLESNKDFVAEYLDTNLSEVIYAKPEGTYFYWLDFKAYKNASKFHEMFLKEGLIFSKGDEFDMHCTSFLRLNFACSRKQLEKALNIMKRVIEKEGMK